MPDAPTDVRFTARFWDERYGSADRIWSGHPNPHLIGETADLTPGTALDAGCGEGADARWLAGRGWRVTATDVSAVALERAAAHAGPDATIAWRQTDLTTWVPDGTTYDLVSAHFLHFPGAVRVPLYAGLAASVTPGGTLLIVGHHPRDMGSTGHGHHEPDMYFTAEEVAGALDPGRWTVQTRASPARAFTGPDGSTSTIHDAVLRARRCD